MSDNNHENILVAVDRPLELVLNTNNNENGQPQEKKPETDHSRIEALIISSKNIVDDFNVG